MRPSGRTIRYPEPTLRSPSKMVKKTVGSPGSLRPATLNRYVFPFLEPFTSSDPIRLASLSAGGAGLKSPASRDAALAQKLGLGGAAFAVARVSAMGIRKRA